MLDLNDPAAIHAADPQHLLDQLLGLPQHLSDGWAAASSSDLPSSFEQIDQVVIAAAGRSGSAGAVFAALIAPECRLPIALIRAEDLPAFAAASRTLVIGISASGNAEETLAALDMAQSRGCQLLVLTHGGELAQRAQAGQITVLPLDEQGSIGWTMAALLNVASRLRWSHDFAADLAETIDITRQWSGALTAGSPVAQNLAKREAGQLMGRWVVVYGAGTLAPVAEYWKQQINVMTQAWAACEVIPDANHHALAGTEWPADYAHKVMALFLTGAADRPRHAQRLALTQRTFMLRGCNTDLVRARGRSVLAQAMSLVLLGDLLSFYLAVLYGADPASREALTAFQAELE
jgi:glucose/mannose-6-phosphate isomerase